MNPVLLLMLIAQSHGPIRLEAEFGTLKGTVVSRDRTGYSGSGYVSNFIASDANVSWHIKAPAGVYRVVVGYSTPSGTKGFDLGVNGHRYSGMLPDIGTKFGRYEASRVELRSGDNEISIERGWGYFDLDYVELTPAPPPPPLKQPPITLTNSKATPATKRLYQRLIQDYGKTMWSGQYDEKECEYVKEKTGKRPAILGGDFMDYSGSRLSHGSNPAGTTERLIDAARKGQILTLSWHWNAPIDLIDKKYKNEKGEEVDGSWYRGFYTNATTFDLAEALKNPKGEAYRLIIADIDRIAIELKKLAKEDVPVLWRPLHEAEGGWFWWGAKGPKPCIELWKILRDRLEKHHQINNLIWVWNSPKPEWYPGDALVDVVSTDNYPSDRSDPISGTWEAMLQQYGGRKPLALAEFSGAPDVERMFQFGVRWSYFVSWTGDVGPRKTDPAVLLRTYRSPKVTNLDNLKLARQ